MRNRGQGNLNIKDEWAGKGPRWPARQVTFSMIEISTDCYSGYRVEERPTRVRFGTLTVTVEHLIDQWLAPDHRYFKFIGDDCATYIIRQDMVSRQWELTFYQHKRHQRIE